MPLRPKAVVGWRHSMLASIPLTASKGIFKRCPWCGSTSGAIAALKPNLAAPKAVARMLCEVCRRQTGWVSAKALRRAERVSGAA